MSMTEKLQETGGSFIESLREAARQNPAAAALIVGVGALLLFAGRPALSAARGGVRVVGAAAEAGQASVAAASLQLRAAGDIAADLAGSAVEGMRNVGDQVRQASQDLGDAAATGGSRLREQSARIHRRLTDQYNAGADSFSSARTQLAEILESQPLALGVIGLAIGAVVAASLPTTRFEDEALGQASDDLRNRVRAAADTAAEEVRRQNLTPEALRNEAENVASKISDIADTAVETIREKMAPPR